MCKMMTSHCRTLYTIATASEGKESSHVNANKAPKTIAVNVNLSSILRISVVNLIFWYSEFVLSGLTRNLYRNTDFST